MWKCEKEFLAFVCFGCHVKLLTMLAMIEEGDDWQVSRWKASLGEKNNTNRRTIACWNKARRK